MAVKAGRRTQAERSAATQALLLDATVACLVELGYAGTTTSAVAQRAGLSRGAQLHHFGTRQRLMSAAVEHLAARRLQWVQETAACLPEDDTRPRRALDLLAEALSGPLYAATLELWVAARVDVALREALVPVEQRVSSRLRRLCREYVTDDPVLIGMTLDLLLGRGVGSLLSPVRPGRQRQLLDAWAAVVARSTDGQASRPGPADRGARGGQQDDAEGWRRSARDDAGPAPRTVRGQADRGAPPGT